MVNLEQIKADIAARKAMPAWGPQTSIERIKTINATLPSFSLKTVEALVEMLESRTVTVKLPPRVDSSNVPFTAHTWNCCLDAVEKCLAGAGIQVIEGEA